LIEGEDFYLLDSVGLSVFRTNNPGVLIRRDAEGRYCLNDLHKAAGEEKRHQPSDFLDLKQTVELVAALFNSGDSRNKNPVSTKAGRYGGTYAVKELVYAYANWISPTFYLQTIRTFDAVVTGNLDALPPAAIAKLLEAVITSPEALSHCSK
jgi:hypothetical protein